MEDFLFCPSGSSSPLDRGPRAALRQSSHQTGRARCQGGNIIFFIVPSSEILKTCFGFSYCPLGGAVCKNTHLLTALYTTVM